MLNDLIWISRYHSNLSLSLSLPPSLPLFLPFFSSLLPFFLLLLWGYNERVEVMSVRGST
jgi:hypothetical protein